MGANHTHLTFIWYIIFEIYQKGFKFEISISRKTFAFNVSTNWVWLQFLFYYVDSMNGTINAVTLTLLCLNKIIIRHGQMWKWHLLSWQRKLATSSPKNCALRCFLLNTDILQFAIVIFVVNICQFTELKCYSFYFFIFYFWCSGYCIHSIGL